MNSLPLRIIARLDLKEEYLIKGIFFEGLKKIGKPEEFANKYFLDGVDEILCIDVMASLFNRKVCYNTLKKVSKSTFIPLTGGGGLNNISDVDNCFSNGCDKISINTSSFKKNFFIRDIIDKYGSQALQGSIQAKKIDQDYYAFSEAGRENSFKKVIDHALDLQESGVGELLISSVDKDGAMSSMEWRLLEKLKNKLSIPIIYGGGLASLEDFKKILYYGFLSGVAIGSALHFKKFSISQLKSLL